MQSAEQNAAQSSQQKPWQIPPKTDGRAYLLARKREAIEAIARELAGEMVGGFDSAPAFKRVLLRQAGGLLLDKRPADPVRTANALRQIYNALGLAPKGRKLMRLPAK